MLYMSNCDGEVEVIERKGDQAYIRFINTGYERWAHIQNVRAGKVRDETISDRRRVTPEEDLPKEILVNNAGQELKVIGKIGKSYTIQFLATGYTRKAFVENVKAGKVRDPYHRSTYNVGYQGEYKKTPYWRQGKQLWQNMLKRCYSTKDTKGYYGKGVSVDDRWQCFANFLEDLPKLDNFQGWLDGQNGNKQKYNLDKDLKVPNNKVYSREVCSFVTEYENKSAGAINARQLDKLKLKVEKE